MFEGLQKLNGQFGVMTMQEGVGDSSLPSPASPTYSVNVGLYLFGALKVDYSLNILDVDSPGCNIGCN